MLYRSFMGEREYNSNQQVREGVLSNFERAYMTLRTLVCVGVDPMAFAVSIFKGLLLATEQRTSATACLSASFMLSGLAKQRFAKEASPLVSVLSASGIPGSSGLVRVLAIWLQPTEQGFQYLQALQGEKWQSTLGVCREVDGAVEVLTKDAIEGALGSRCSESFQRHGARRGERGVLALNRALEEHLCHDHIGSLPLTRLVALRGHRLSESRELGSLAMGIMSWVTPREQKCQDFSQINPKADNIRLRRFASYLSKVLGEVSLQPKLHGKVHCRGSLPSQNGASSSGEPAEVAQPLQANAGACVDELLEYDIGMLLLPGTFPCAGLRVLQRDGCAANQFLFGSEGPKPRACCSQFVLGRLVWFSRGVVMTLLPCAPYIMKKRSFQQGQLDGCASCI